METVNPGSDNRSSRRRLASDLAEIERTLRRHCGPGEIIEIRALDSGPRNITVAGYFDYEHLSEAAKLTGQLSAGAIYITLNRVDPACLARSANHFTERPKQTTADKEIIRRSWLLLDFDPHRVSGVSASDNEKAEAMERAEACREFLAGRGWISPVTADSGNGSHLLLRVDLPADDESTALIKRVLQALGMMFSDARVDLDLTVFNAARICKLHGTIAGGKGDDTPTRPHRISRILEDPGLRPGEIVTRGQLQAVADLYPEDEPRRGGAQSFGAFDIEIWLRDHAVPVTSPVSYQGGLRWLFRPGDDCPFGGAHNAAGAFVIKLSSGAIAAGCRHNSCRNFRWVDLRRKYEPAFDSGRNGTAQHAAEPAADQAGYKPPKQWPTLDRAALHGLAGDFVRLILPHTESDAVALLVQFMVAVGNLVGHNLYGYADGSRHHLNEFAVLVGNSSKSRKGSSWAWVRRALKDIEPFWATQCIKSGLSSGEGLTWSVRDPILDKDGKEVDAGAPDKRLLVVEPEFVSVLRNCERERNILSPTIRQAWDDGDLWTLTKNSKATASNTHISIIAHITAAELQRSLDDTSAANGLGNRFLWLCVRRSKVLALPGQPDGRELAELVERVKDVNAFGHDGRHGREFRFNREATEQWVSIYETLSAERPGLLGALLARAEAHVLRLACLYAVLGRSIEIKSEHLLAARALWNYVDLSAGYLFEDRLGDPDADAVLTALRQAEDGLSRTQISNLFNRNLSSSRIDRALGALLQAGLVTVTERPSGKRPASIYAADRSGVGVGSGKAS